MAAATGKDPNLADIVRMVHPKPDGCRAQGVLWLADRASLMTFARFACRDRRVRGLEVGCYTATATGTVRMAHRFSADARRIGPSLRTRIGWQALRMNLNTPGA